MQEFDVIFYAKSDGSEPVKEFLDSLDIKMRAKVVRTIDILSQNGSLLREPYSKHLKDGIFELRAKVGTNISRVLYFFIMDNQIVLTNGFIKKTKKTPIAEIKKATDYRADYLRRIGNNKFE